MRKVAPLGSRLVLQARLVNMKKFGLIIVMYSVANPLLYLLAIGAGVGTLINRSSGGIDGVPYLVFLAPALLANAAIQGSMDETVFPTLGGFLWNKTFYIFTTFCKTCQSQKFFHCDIASIRSKFCLC